MAELTPQERLQPSLLDRLTDENPEKGTESRDQRVLSMQQLREGVKRDLAWLLNTVNLQANPDFADDLPLDDYPEVLDSVLNYGLPDLAGKTGSTVNTNEIEQLLKNSILSFEPRILSRSLQVRVQVNEDQMNRNSMVIEIEGELWAQPVSERVYLKTEVDLETGNVSVEDFTGKVA